MPAWATRELNSLGSNTDEGGVTREVREVREDGEGEEGGVPNWVKRAMGDNGDALEVGELDMCLTLIA